jgi:N-acylneuraminate cytidylyltransferase
VDRVIVSTDDPEIAEVARQCGAEAPFLRPAELAGDDTPDLPVFAHALRWLEREQGWRPDVIVQLRPTSPFREPGLVDAALELLRRDASAESVRTVVEPAQNPYKMWRRSPISGYLSPLLHDGGPEAYNQPRQALPPTLWQTGHLDAFRRETVLQKRTLTGDRVLPLRIAARHAVDLDTPEQWEYAEWLMRRGGLAVVRPGQRPCPVNG